MDDFNIQEFTINSFNRILDSIKFKEDIKIASNIEKLTDVLNNKLIDEKAYLALAEEYQRINRRNAMNERINLLDEDV